MKNVIKEKMSSSPAQVERVVRLFHGAEHFEAFCLPVQEEKRQPASRKKARRISVKALTYYTLKWQYKHQYTTHTASKRLISSAVGHHHQARSRRPWLLYGVSGLCRARYKVPWLVQRRERANGRHPIYNDDTLLSLQASRESWCPLVSLSFRFCLWVYCSLFSFK